MKRALILALVLVGLIFVASARAQDSSPYVVGHWNLSDSFQDFTGGTAITTDNTDFTFLNPTALTLTLPNRRTRYTMLGEQQGSQFSTSMCNTSKGSALTEGELKSIVFVSEDKD